MGPATIAAGKGKEAIDIHDSQSTSGRLFSFLQGFAARQEILVDLAAEPLTVISVSRLPDSSGKAITGTTLGTDGLRGNEAPYLNVIDISLAS